MLMCVTTRNGVAVRHYWNSYSHASPTLQNNNPTYNQQVRHRARAATGGRGRVDSRARGSLKSRRVCSLVLVPWLRQPQCVSPRCPKTLVTQRTTRRPRPLSPTRSVSKHL